MKISSIKKMSGTKYKITFDDGETFNIQDQVIIDYNLLFKKEIDNDLLLKVLKENEKYEVYNKVVKYIMKKMRTTKEIEKYIEKNELSNKEKEDIFDKLRSINLLNHSTYASSYVTDKFNLSKEGPIKIKKDLELKGIESDYINSALEKFDIDERKQQMILLLEKKVNNNKKYSNYEMKRRLVTELNRLGYSSDFISECFEEIVFSNNDVIKNEYTKIIRKLERKFSGTELIFKAKQKLYQKGFNSEEINNLLNDI